MTISNSFSRAALVIGFSFFGVAYAVAATPSANVTLPFPGGYYLADAKVLEPGKFRMEVFASDHDVIAKHGGKGGSVETVKLSQAENEKLSKQFGCYNPCAAYLHKYQVYSPIAYASWGTAIGPDGSVYLSGNPALTKIPASDPTKRIVLLPDRITGYDRSADENTVEPVYAYAGKRPVVTAQGKVFILGEHELEQVVGPSQIKKIPLPPDQGKPQDFPPLGIDDLTISPFGCILVPAKGKLICVDADGKAIPDYEKLPYSTLMTEKNILAGRIPGREIFYKNNSYATTHSAVVVAPGGEYFYALMSQYRFNGKLPYSVEESRELPLSLYRFRVEKHECDSRTNKCKFKISKPELLVRGSGNFLSPSMDLHRPDHNFRQILVARNGDVYLLATYTIYKLTPNGSAAADKVTGDAK